MNPPLTSVDEVADDYFRNDPDSFLSDSLRGFVATHDDIDWHRDPGFLSRSTPTPRGRVAIVSGGGSGHEPMHAGLIGAGMLDAACPGLVFTSPNALQIAAATRRVHSDSGVLHVVKNYTGDVMNFGIARTIVGDEGIDTDVVLVDDDVATESADGPGRRGTGATVVVEKVCGAAAADGASLAELTSLGRRVVANARSMSVALAPCTVPGATAPSFDLAETEMELGIGIHGEAGTERKSRESAHRVVSALLGRIRESLELESGEPVIVLVNGLGATHPLELNLLFGEVVAALSDASIPVVRSLVGTVVTALDMRGASLTLVRADEDIIRYWDAPTAAPGWPAVLPKNPPRLVDTTFAHPRDDADSGPECGWLGDFVSRVQSSIDDLTELDRRAGDGDFGANLDAALGHFTLPLRGSDSEVLEAISRSFLVRAGGTSGAVFGTLFRALARAFDVDTRFRESLAAGTRTGLRDVVALGGARVGDNTVVDALEPAGAALAEGAGLDAVARAAADGAESTRAGTARKGRASYVGEAARGVVDPGALVVSWLYRAAAGRAD